MKTRIMAMIALAAVALVGCSKNEDVAVNVLPEDGIIRVMAGVNELATRAGITNTSLTSFGLSISNGTAPTYSYSNVYIKKESNVWNPYKAPGTALDAPMLWNKPDQMVAVTAYHPYQASANILNGTFSSTISDDQSKAENVELSDLLYAMNSFTPATSDINNDIYYDATAKSLVVKMNHKMSKLRLNLRYGTELTQGGVTPTLGDVTLVGTKIGYTFSFVYGTINPQSSTESNIKMFHESTPSKDFDATYEAIIVPQSTPFSVKLIVNGKEYIYRFQSSPSNYDYTFESDKIYTLNLTVGKDVVNSGFSSVNWENGTGNDLETE